MSPPTARDKLNVAFCNGALVAGLMLGAVTGSFFLGLLVFGLLIALAINAGDIRLQPRNRKN